MFLLDQHDPGVTTLPQQHQRHHTTPHHATLQAVCGLAMPLQGGIEAVAHAGTCLVVAPVPPNAHVAGVVA